MVGETDEGANNPGPGPPRPAVMLVAVAAVVPLGRVNGQIADKAKMSTVYTIGSGMFWIRAQSMRIWG